MKDIRKAFRQLLLDDAAVANLANDRIFPLLLPEGQRAPSLVYHRISDFSDYHMLGDSGLQRVFMQLDSWGENHNLAANLADAAHDAISGFKGLVSDQIDIQGIFQSNGRDLYDDVTQMFRVSRDYQIAYNEGAVP